jgi:hypothetical protein
MNALPCNFLDNGSDVFGPVPEKKITSGLWVDVLAINMHSVVSGSSVNFVPFAHT